MNCVFGFANCGELNEFSASARNCPFNRSRMENSLNNELSQFFIPGPRYGMVLDTLPKVNAGACEKAAGLMYPLTRLSTLPDTAGSSPVAFGRFAPVARLEFTFRC